MKADRATAGLLRESDGSFSASYGPYVLRTGFQPIFSQNAAGDVKIEAVEALIRPFKGDEAVSPAQFFCVVEEADVAAVERLSRRLHIVNMGHCEHRDLLLFLNFNPQAFSGYAEMDQEAEDVARLAGYLELAPEQIVCEIIEKHVGARSMLLSLVEALRARGFRIAIDDFGAEESDSERVRLLKPEIVKFDALWARRFLETSEGFALLRTMVRRFSDDGIMTLFEGLEEHWQVASCRALGVRLLQGYVLAKPELAIGPTPRSREAGEPEGDGPAPDKDTELATTETLSATLAAAPTAAAARPRRAVFGRRGR
ncbi:MAG: EAL domain-containing protein [Pararhizobium sp.]